MKSRILKEIHALASGAGSAYLDSLCRELRLDEQTVRKRAAEARSRILHDYSRFTVLTIDTFFQRILRAFIKEPGTGPQLQRRDRDGLGALEERRLAHRPDHRRPRPRTVAHGIRAGTHRRGTQMGRPRRHPFAGRGSFSRKGTRRRSPRRVRRRSWAKSWHAPRRRRRPRARRCAGRLRKPSRRSRPQDSRRPTSRARAAASQAISTPWPEASSKPPRKPSASGRRHRRDGRRRVRPQSASYRSCDPCCKKLCTLYDENIRLWNTCDLLRENYRSFALLSDLYARVQQALRRAKHDAALRNQIPPLGVHRPQRRSVHLRKGGQPLRTLHDRRVPGHLLARMGRTSCRCCRTPWRSRRRPRCSSWATSNSRSTAGGAATGGCCTTRRNGRSARRTHGSRCSGRTGAACRASWNSTTRRSDRIVSADNLALNTRLDEAAGRGDIGAEEAAALRDTLADAYREQAQTPRRRGEHPGYVSIETFAERPPVVERICELIDRGFRPADIMVLVRSATDGAKVAAEPAGVQAPQRGAALPVRRDDAGGAHRGQRPRELVHRRRAAAGARPRRHAQPRRLTTTSAAISTGSSRTGSGGFFRSIRLLSPEEAFERIVMRHDLQGDRRQIAYLQAIHEQIIAFSAAKIADIALFLRWWDEQGRNRSLSVEQSATTVEITTVHKAKGARKTGRHHPLLLLAARPQVGRQRAEHRLGGGPRRRSGCDRPLPGALQTGDGRIGFLGRILPRTGTTPTLTT